LIPIKRYRERGQDVLGGLDNYYLKRKPSKKSIKGWVKTTVPLKEIDRKRSHKTSRGGEDLQNNRENTMENQLVRLRNGRKTAEVLNRRNGMMSRVCRRDMWGTGTFSRDNDVNE